MIITRPQLAALISPFAVAALAAFASAAVAGQAGRGAPPAPTPPCGPNLPAAVKNVAKDSRCFELRTYTVQPGSSSDLLHARFREHTSAFFKKHGMTIVGYWQPVTKPDTLIYLLAYKDGAARDASWAAFQADPEWVKTRAAERDRLLADEITARIRRRSACTICPPRTRRCALRCDLARGIARADDARMPRELQDIVDPDKPVTRRELAAELQSFGAELRAELQVEFRAELHAGLRDLRAEFRSQFATKAELEAFTVDIRTHFDIIAEHLRGDFANVIDWLKANLDGINRRIDALETGHGGRLGALEGRVTKLEAERN
jgi:hypothetical protein